MKLMYYTQHYWNAERKLGPAVTHIILTVFGRQYSMHIHWREPAEHRAWFDAQNFPRGKLKSRWLPTVFFYVQ